MVAIEVYAGKAGDVEIMVTRETGRVTLRQGKAEIRMSPSQWRGMVIKTMSLFQHRGDPG